LSKRQSCLPAIKINYYGPKPATPAVCVGCGSSVKPGFCYTGSVIDGLGFTSVTGHETTPILGVMETYEKSYVIGGEDIETVKRVSFFKRKKGFICDRCASNYGTVSDSTGRKHEIVKTDSKPGYIGNTIIPVWEK
jgi:hypothetical protein